MCSSGENTRQHVEDRVGQSDLSTDPKTSGGRAVEDYESIDHLIATVLDDAGHQAIDACYGQDPNPVHFHESRSIVGKVIDFWGTRDGSNGVGAVIRQYEHEQGTTCGG